jgi:hypothetical protein
MPNGIDDFFVDEKDKIKKIHYIFDTSSIVKMKAYPRKYKRFKDFWEKLDELIDNAQLYIPKEVKLECQHPAEIKFWIEDNEDFILYDKPDLYDELARVNKKYPKFAVQDLKNTGKYYADPHVVALANLFKKNRIESIIITEETFTGKNKIPSIAEKYDLKCQNLLELLENLGVLKV